MLRRLSPVLLGLVLACSSDGPGNVASPNAFIRVSAAISVSEPLQVLARGFEQETGTSVELNLAGSSTLAAQLLAGAHVDLFLSADTRQMDRVVADGLIPSSAPINLLSNRLVVVVPSAGFLPSGRFESPAVLTDPLFRRIAIGDPAGVPAGVYARAYLKSISLWGALSERMVPTRSVRAALAIVEVGEVDAGIVYRTDARTTDGVQIVFDVAAEDGPAIVYSAAVLSGARDPDTAEHFLSFLQRPASGAVFDEAGFVLLSP